MNPNCRARNLRGVGRPSWIGAAGGGIPVASGAAIAERGQNCYGGKHVLEKVGMENGLGAPSCTNAFRRGWARARGRGSHRSMALDWPMATPLTSRMGSRPMLGASTPEAAGGPCGNRNPRRVGRLFRRRGRPSMPRCPLHHGTGVERGIPWLPSAPATKRGSDHEQTTLGGKRERCRLMIAIKPRLPALSHSLGLGMHSIGAVAWETREGRRANRRPCRRRTRVCQWC